MSCILKNCKSVWAPKSGIKLHSFPKDPNRRATWLSLITIKGKFYENAKICSLHFKETDYDVNRPGYLIKNANPYYLPPQLDKDPSQANMADTSNRDDNSKENKEHSPQNDIDQCPPHSQQLYALLTKARTEPEPSSSKQVHPALTKPRKKRKLRTSEQEYQPSRVLPGMNDFTVQARLKTPREIELEKTNKHLKQKLIRQNEKINSMGAIINIIRNYTSQTEIENIVQGNFTNLCKALKKPPHKKIYSKDVKLFALTLHNYSPEAYEFLREKLQLPDEDTLLES